MKDLAASESELATGMVSTSIPDAPMICPVSVMPPEADALSSGVCQILEDAGCPLAAETHKRLTFETLLTELSSRFVNVPAGQVDAQIERGLQRIVELLGIDRSGLGEVSADGTQFVVTHSYQLPGVPPSAQRILHVEFPIYARMLRQGQVIRMPKGLPPEATREREYCRRIGMKSHLAIPLTVMGNVVGGIGFTSLRSSRVLSDELILRLRLVGDIFTHALARKRADETLRAREQSLRRAREGLRQLAAKLLSSQEEERRRIAREMHDDWTQRLAILGIDTARLETHLGTRELALPLLHAIREQLVSLSEDVHALSRQLHPAILDDLGLVEALRSECAGFARREEIAVDYRPGQLPATVSTDVALCLYRVAQEALRNVAKHAATTEVCVTLNAIGPEVVLRIEDRGVGFDPENERTQPGLGLSSMAERVTLVHGRFSVAAAVGRGTTIEVRAPLDERTS